MSKKLKAGVVSISVLAFIFIVIGGLGVRASGNEGAYRQLGVYSEVLQRIRNEYVEEPNFEAVRNGALHGLVESLDANSSYLNPAEYKRYKETKVGKAGIGASISKRFGYAAIVATIPGGPADKAGLENGDILEAIEGRSTRELSIAEIRSLVAGQKGSNITFSVVRPRKPEPAKVVVTRDEISFPATSEKIIENNVGYLKPVTLTSGKAQEIAAKIKQLEKAGAKKFILDLRNVSEGEISEGIATANLFLERGIISYRKGQKVTREDFNADPKNAVTKLPVVVIVNRGTSGAAEVAAAAILENGRGDLLGDKTFGNATVQKLIEIADGSAVILSVAKYYSPSGKAIQDSAVTPNILVPDTVEAAVTDNDGDGEADTLDESQLRLEKSKRADEQLQRALAALKAKAS